MCSHEPPCPGAEAPDREAAVVVSAHPDRGWSLLCNGVVLFNDTAEVPADIEITAPCGQRHDTRHQPGLGQGVRCCPRRRPE
ncbi:DUF5999 family protein [Streptomyces sp. NPDC014983]|uniref:DUF5999 family protein n=1 Tax=Streptomyces sp. NPDC014983 TaxID=3364933 RepID=UPI003700CBD5